MTSKRSGKFIGSGLVAGERAACRGQAEFYGKCRSGPTSFHVEPSGKWAPVGGVSRGTSLADTEARKDLPQQVIGAEFAGDSRETLLPQPEFFRHQFKDLIAGNSRE